MVWSEDHGDINEIAKQRGEGREREQTLLSAMEDAVSSVEVACGRGLEKREGDRDE